jgi:ribosomal protein L11
MADDITKTTQALKQQIENAKLLNEEMERLRASGIDAFGKIKDSIDQMAGSTDDEIKRVTKVKDAFGDIEASLKEALGTQFKYATELEKTMILSQNIAKVEDLRLQKLLEQERIQKHIHAVNKELETSGDRISARLAELVEHEKELVRELQERQDLTEEHKLQIRDGLTGLRAQLVELSNINELSEDREKLLRNRAKDLQHDLALVQDITGEDEKDLKELKKKINALRAVLAARDKERKKGEEIRKTEDSAEAIAQNRLESALGLKDATADFADLLIDAGGDAKKLDAIAQGLQKAFKKAFDPKVLMKSLKNFGKDFIDKWGKIGKDALIGPESLQQKVDDMEKRLIQTTGATDKLGKAARELTDEMVHQGFVYGEVENAMGGLYMSSAAFTKLAEDEQYQMGKLALQLGSLGVNTNTFGASMNKMLKVFKYTPAQTRKVTTELSNFGRALGTGPNKMLQQFNEQMPLIARYGREKGVEMFKQLATTAHLAGIEMSDLVNIAKTFDTFEGAAEAAGKLNYMLGGPLLNSMDLLNASEADRIQMLRDAMKESGRSFKELGRFEKDLIADTLKTRADVAQALFEDEDLSSLEAAAKKIEGQAKSLGKVKDQSKDARTAEQNLAASRQKAILETGILSDILKALNKKWIELQGILAEFSPVIALLGLAFTILSGVIQFQLMRSIAIANGTAGLGGLSKAFLGLGGKGGTIMKFVKGPAGVLAGFALISYGAIKLLGGVKSWIDKQDWTPGQKKAGKAAASGVTFGAIGAGAGAMLGAKIGAAGGPIGIAGGALIGGALGIAGGVISEYLEDGTDNLPRYAGGIDSIGSKAALAKHGQAIITGDSSDGRAKPELTVAPPKSAVINNKNLESLANTINNVQNLSNTMQQVVHETTNIMQNKLGAQGEQTVNITLKMDSDILAKHSRKIATDVLETHMEINL